MFGVVIMKKEINTVFDLKGGVLIIGSLLWQNHLEKTGDDLRKNWRLEHIDADQKIMAHVPIRYGRLTDKGRIYTMTFSNSLNKNEFGTGYFVPFKKKIITLISELFYEATELSKAEGMKGKFSTDWGTLAILFNTSKMDSNIKIELANLWANKIYEERNFNNLNYRVSESEQPCINADGQLNFGWVNAVDERQENLLNSYDFILATATLPTDYPSLKDLSINVKSDKSRYYFIENYKSGITTFQDIPVLNSMYNI